MVLAWLSPEKASMRFFSVFVPAYLLPALGSSSFWKTEAGCLHTGHFSGGSSPSCMYPQTEQRHFVIFFSSFFGESFSGMSFSSSSAFSLGKPGDGGLSTNALSISWALRLWGSMYPASLRMSSAIRRLDISAASISWARNGSLVFPAMPAAILSCLHLDAAREFRAETTLSVFFCCGGYSKGAMVMAPEGQAMAHSPQPMHFDTSMMLSSVSVAPVGQTYRHRQSLVQSLRFLTANFLMPPPSSLSS